jgi:tryptophan 2,3-dioxygenase
MPAALTYSSYLKLDELLSLQALRTAGAPDGPEHDEMLFIVIHQVYELWFKQMIHEADRLREVLATNDHPTAHATLRRMLTILKTLVAQVDVLETMTPVSFSSFRSRLDSASGFQSAQFRELEFVLGKKSQKALANYPAETGMRRRLDKRFGEPTVWDAFVRMLAARGYEVPTQVLERDVSSSIEPNPALQQTLIRVYHDDAQTRQICELLVDLDEGIQEWRYRHVKMVQRTIGSKPGTGGSAGAAYLITTLMTPLFPDLWEIRASL